MGGERQRSEKYLRFRGRLARLDSRGGGPTWFVLAHGSSLRTRSDAIKELLLAWVKHNPTSLLPPTV